MISTRFNVIARARARRRRRREAYRYLVESIRDSPTRCIREMMRTAGFARASFHAHERGIVALHSGWRL